MVKISAFWTWWLKSLFFFFFPGELCSMSALCPAHGRVVQALSAPQQDKSFCAACGGHTAGHLLCPLLLWLVSISILKHHFVCPQGNWNQLSLVLTAAGLQDMCWCDVAERYNECQSIGNVAVCETTVIWYRINKQLKDNKESWSWHL